MLIPISVEGRRRHSQFDYSLPLPKPCNHTQAESTHPHSKPVKVHVLESFDTL